MATVGTPGAIQQAPPTAGSYGQGIAYPLSITTQGRLATASGPVLVEQQLRAIWDCSPGERPMLPKFGADVGEFEPLDLNRQIERYKSQVAEYVPAVDTIELEVEDGPGQGEATVSVAYTLTGEDSERVLTFPIFVGPQGG